MDAENFAKLTTILDVLDHHKKSLTQAVQHEPASQASLPTHTVRILSKRSTHNGGIFGYGSVRSASSQRETFATALERRKTMKRAETLLIRRRTRIRKSLPSLSELASKSVSLSCLDQELQEHIVSKGMLHIFESHALQVSNEDCEARSDCLDYMSESGSELLPDVDWEERSQSQALSACSLENLTTDDYTNLHPQVLGQLFDRILDYLQNDFEELLEKLKEQNGHLKQEVGSLKKKLHDAVKTNDQQVQELKEMTERISDLEAEGRELSRQLSLLESRIKQYQESQKGLMKMEEEKSILDKEVAALQKRLKEMSLQASTQETQKVTELAHDIVTLKGTTEAQDEEIKALKRELERKEKLLETANLTLASQKISTMDSPRGEISSRQATPRGSAPHLFLGMQNPRRVSVKQLLTAVPPVAQDASLSLASELQMRTETVASTQPPRLSLVREKLNSTLLEVEELRKSNDELKKEIMEIRKEMQAKDAAMNQQLEERSAELAAARSQLERESEELQRTAQALEVSKEDLRISNAALLQKTADNEKLLAQVEEAKQMLRTAQENHVEALARRASPEVVKALEDKVAELAKELRTKAALLDQSEENKKKLEDQRAALQLCVDANMKQIEELSSRVKSLEGQLVAKTDVVNALEAEIGKLMELVQRGDVTNEEREGAEKQRKSLLELLEKERNRASSLEEIIAKQRSVEAERKEFEANSKKLQLELKQQADFLRERLAKQEGETEAVKRELAEQASAAEKAQEDLQQALRSSYEKLQELQEQLGMLTEERDEIKKLATEEKLETGELTKLNGKQQESLEMREQEIKQLQEQLQEHIEEIKELTSREEQYKAKVELLQEEISALDVGLRTEKEETQRLLAIKDEEIRQVELAQKEVLEAMKEQIDKLKKDRRKLFDEDAEKEYSKLQQEYSALLETVDSLRNENSELYEKLQNEQSDHASQAQQLIQKHMELLDKLHEAEDRYKELQSVLHQNTADYRKSLEDAQRKLAELQPQIEHMTVEHRIREEFFKTRLAELEKDRHRLQEEIDDLKEKNEEASKLLREEEQAEKAELRAQRDYLAAQVEILQEQFRARGFVGAQALKQTEENQKAIQQLFTSLSDQQRSLSNSEKSHVETSYLSAQLDLVQKTLAESKAVEDSLLLVNEQIRKENESLKAEVDQLRSSTAADRHSELAAVLEEVQRQLHDLSSEFSAFKKGEGQQNMDLNGAVGGTTQVFNVSYPPFVIPLVNVHESKDSNDKTISISGEALKSHYGPSNCVFWLILGMLDVRAAATGLMPPGFGNLNRSPAPTLHRSRFQDWLCKWKNGWCSFSGHQSQDSCCAASSNEEETHADRWLTQTRVYKPTGRDVVQALRVHMGDSEPSPRLEGPFQLSEDSMHANGEHSYNDIQSATAC